MPGETSERVERLTTIRPAPRRPHLDVPELWHYRGLLGRFVWRDVKVRYKQTSLGVAWALLVPIFSAVIYVVVFGKFANFPSGSVPYATLVLSGLIVMQYFNSSLTGSSLSLVANLARDQGLLSTRASASRGGNRPRGRLRRRIPRPHPADGLLPRRTGRDRARYGPALPLARIRDSARGGLLPVGVQRPLPGRPTHAPRVHARAPVGLGRPLRGPGDSGEVAVDPRLQSHDGSDQRLALGHARRPEPNWAQTAVGVAVALVFFVFGLAVFRSSEPRFADTI